MRVSDEVWDEIAKIGKFGESVDDVLRRVFGLSPSPDEASDGRATKRTPSGRRIRATNRMSSSITSGRLVVQFRSGDREEFKLPDKADKLGIKAVRDQACAFAEKNGATLGQVNAVKKTLTEAGYYVSR